ncbi:endonuclease III [Deferrisoma camini]|uniref:endonuclease III n=1 Tax=Deferrisoma camini TaxID=1035120 RepID=UPI00046D2A84|nr:endonuclease III [Deferrisoma camini]
MDDRERAAEIDRILRARYPETTALRFRDPFTLLVAAILAAQCTDERVNRVTETLFDRFPTPEAFARADLAEIEQAVRPTGYYRQKARTLQTCCRELVERFGGRVPESVEQMVTLPGVGRKTANLVLGNSLGIPGVFVDTHVKRVSARLGLTRHTDPDRIEADLERLVPPERRVAFSNLLTHLGREICKARKPRCEACPVESLCPRMGVGP